MLALPGGTVPVTVATPCLRAQWLPGPAPMLSDGLRVGDTLRAFANAVTAVSLSSLLTCSALGLVFRLGGRADQEAFHGSMACLTCRLCSQITSRLVSRAWPGDGRGDA